MIVGDAPSFSDSRAGEYLQGKTGSLLEDELRKVGFPRTPYYTGVAKCSCPEGRKPEPSEMKACGRHLQNEILANKPRFILTLGASATKTVAREAKITTSVGKINERDGITYMPCYSPAYVLRDPGKMREFQKTLQRFRELVVGGKEEEEELRVRVIDRSNLEEFMGAFEQEVEFAYDLETSGLDHYNPHSYINCMGTYLPKDQTAWVLPIRKAPTLPQEAQDQLIRWMADLKKKAIGHNCIPSESEVMTRNGWKRIIDASIGEDVLQWDSRTNQLEWTPIRGTTTQNSMENYSWDTSFHRGEYTPEHRIYFHTHSSEQWIEGTAGGLSKRYCKHLKIPVSGSLSVGYDLPEPLIRVMEMFRADGSFMEGSRGRLKFKKSLKVCRARNLLISSGANFKERLYGDVTVFNLPNQPLMATLRDLLGEQKSYKVVQAISWGFFTRSTIIDEAKYWDSHIQASGAYQFSTIDKDTAESMEFMAHSTNWSVSGDWYDNVHHNKLYGQNCLPIWRGYFRPRSKVKLVNNPTLIRYPEPKSMSCITVDSGAFLTRINGRIVITGNCKFDSLWIRRKVWTHFYSHFDTMLAHYMLDENSPHGLKELSRYYLNAKDYDLTTAEKKGDTDANKLFTYCAQDCYNTYRLYRIFSRELMKDLETRNLFLKLMMPMARLYEEIEMSGHHVNLERMRVTRIDMHNKMTEELRLLNKTLGREINWNSPAQVGKALYGDLGLVPSVFTDKGAVSTGEAALSTLDHPVVKLLQDYRGHQKFISTYIDGWEEFMVGSELFLSTKLHGTVTGRYSSRLHQVPRDGAIRNLIEAPEGYTFVQADLSQAELRIAGIVSRDPELIRCYNEGIDVHWRTAMENLRLQGSGDGIKMARETVEKYLGHNNTTSVSKIVDVMLEMGHEKAIEINKGWKEYRKQAKGINFGFLYSMGAKKFTEYAKLRYGWDITIKEADDIRNNYFATYAALPAWHEMQKSLVKIDGFVRSLAGRKRRLPGIWSPEREVKAEAERQAINSPIQGMIGDLKAMGMLTISQKIPRDLVVIKGEVHDSVLMWVKTQFLDEVLPQIKQCMEHPDLIDTFGIDLPIPIQVDLEVGTWGKGSTWHPK